MIGIVDYGMGNLLSVFNAVEYLGFEVEICNDPLMLSSKERIILPGVGAFGDCIKNLKDKGFIDVLNEMVIDRRKPILGICLGMQAMAKRSYEGGEYTGLGWFDADVIRLEPKDVSLRVPHVGWNNVSFRSESPLFQNIPAGRDFYFVHSYRIKCNDEKDMEATCDYGGPFACAVRKNNIFATQFHPEKSQDYGLKVLDNFIKWNP
jgi:imidazole glycerol-phosphate synthase subunit HisH